ncbi:hypothetical protein HYX06_03535 [Candidatus Woesearchaeota archaeon]|nr:hypothetical protein [Candidatus Woesearchaeota archaeon]
MKFNELDLNGVTIKDFAYWIGVAQTDGHLHIPKATSYSAKNCKVVLGVGIKSLPMLNKFIVISRSVFGLKGHLCSRINHNGTKIHLYNFGCNRFVSNFETLQINFKQVIPPDWILENNELFGAYLAGVIDGDGDTRISRIKYPQGYIRIYSGCRINKFITAIKTLLNCGVFVEERVRTRRIGDYSFLSHCFTIEFQITYKNLDFFKNYVVDNIAIEYKRKVIENYIEYKEHKLYNMNL